MDTKLIKLSMEAYDKLLAARYSDDESFSEVICRAEWPQLRGTAGDMLKAMQNNEAKADVAFLAEMKAMPPYFDDPWER